MFGKNPIRVRSIDPRQLAVEDIFYTIQGEGPLSGMPALFIRLAGCNLACAWCDTQFETHAEDPRKVEEVFNRVLEFPVAQRRLVVVTGGEPMLQNWSRLCAGLFSSGTSIVQVETAGTLWQPDFDRLATNPSLMFVCSPKTPKVNQRIADVTRHWKYIVRAGELGEDGLPCKGTQTGNLGKPQTLYRPDRAGRGWRDTIWLSPCDDHNPMTNKGNMMAARDACLAHGYRLSLQTHKIIEVA